MMNKQAVKGAGTRLIAQAARKRFDLALGMALFRDKRIGWSKKALAVGIGFVGMLLIQVLEIPVELLTVVFGSPFGLEDALEGIVWPIVIAAAVLPHVAPVAAVDRLRAERAVHV